MILAFLFEYACRSVLQRPNPQTSQNRYADFAGISQQRIGLAKSNQCESVDQAYSYSVQRSANQTSTPLYRNPARYTPYMMIGLDLLMGGTSAAAQGVVGALVGHLWWWGVWGSGDAGAGADARGVLEEVSRAPGWLRGLIGEGEGAGGAAGGGRDAGRGGGGGVRVGGGVQVIPPRRPLGGGSTSGSSTATSTRGGGGGGSSSGYNWGSGQRLGTE